MKPPITLTDAERSRLLSLARGLLGNQADAEDTLHEAWLRASSAAPADLAQPLAWLTTVMKNLAVDTLRQRQLRQSLLARQVPEGGSAASAEDSAATWQRCEQALRRLADTLAPADAAMLLLHEVFGFAHAAIAERAGRSEAACRQAVHRALLRLREAPPGTGPEDRATADALYVLCLRALQLHSPAPLHAILATPISASLRQGAAPVAVASDRGGVVQVDGGYSLVLVHQGRVVGCLPLGPVVTAFA
jgi:RNA polymerase sigma-70 factor (ECF subfamily)